MKRRRIMKDVTFGVKVPEELRDQINEMMKGSGLVGREFMQQLVDSYLLDRNKQEIPEMAEEIKELQSLTHRINEMYLYLGTRFENIASLSKKDKEDMDQIISETNQSYQENIKNYKSEIKGYEDQIEKFKKMQETIEDSNKELSLKINEINSYNENYQELNNQYKKNILELTNKLEALRPLEEENDKLLSANNLLQEGNDNLASDLWFAKRDIEKLNNELIKNQTETERRVLHLKDQHHLEKQTTVLELQLKHQKDIEALNSKMANMQEEYHDKLKQLIFQIEDKKQVENTKQKKLEKED